MHFKTRIACYGNHDIALDVARETIVDAGFEALSPPEAEVQEFVNPRPWRLTAQNPLALSDRVVVRSVPNSLVLEGDADGVPRRTMLLAYAAGFAGLLLILNNALWALKVQPLYKALLPVAPWPVLVPLIHKNLNWLARRKWNLTLRMIGRSAALKAAERMAIEEPVAAAPTEEPAPTVLETAEQEREELLV